MSNIVLNPGSLGATLGTDQVAGVDYQKIKVTFSTDGVAPVSVDATHGLPVAVVAALPTGANTIGAVTQAAGPWTSNLTQLVGTAVATGNGVAGAGVLRVAICSDNTSLTNAIPVSQSGAPWSMSGSGNFAITAASLPLPTGASTAAKQPALGTAGTASTDVLTIQGIASMTAVKTDGSAVTQPVSAAALPLPAGAATAAKQPALGTAGAASTDVISIQGIASMTKLLVTPDSVALPANQSVNMAQVAGTTTDTNSGNKSAGTIRVVIANDQPSMVNAQPVSQSGSPWGVTDAPVTTGGLSRNYQIAPATPAKTVVKGSAGQLYAIKASNNNATPVYVKLFDALTGSVTLGTTACDDQFEVPGNTAGAGFVYNVDKGIAFATGIIAAVTNAISSTDNTAIAASSVILTLYFK